MGATPENLRELLRHLLKLDYKEADVYAIRFTSSEREMLAQAFENGAVFLRRLNKALDDEEE